MKEYNVSRKTAITAITALRHYNKILEHELEIATLMNEADVGNYQSIVESIQRFKDLAKEAFNELQKETGDKTPLKIKEHKHGF
jgi:hypothetical protein